MKNNQVRRIGESTHQNGDVSFTVIEEEEVEKLGEEVIEMAKRVEEYRSSLPQHFKSSLSSLLALHRPPSSLLDSPAQSSGSHTHTGLNSRHGNSSTDLDDDGEQSLDEVKLLRDKISSNISALPKVLKRMNECISRVDKLVSSNETIHPVFKRKKS